MLGAKDGQRKQDYFSLDLSCACRGIEPNYEPATDLMHPCKIELEVSEILGDDEVRDTEDFGLIQHDGCEIQAPCKWRLAHRFRQPSSVDNIMPQDLEWPTVASQAEESQSSRVVQGRKHRDVQLGTEEEKEVTDS